jgi:hypothetical protein
MIARPSFGRVDRFSVKQQQEKMQKIVLMVLTLMLSGRAMTLAFIHRAGAGGAGDPPAAWLMPLIGDAVIGITGLVMVYLILRGKGLRAWTALVVWNAVAIWDALSAYIVHLTNPWPEFFMIKLAGVSMFFLASAMHAVNLALLARCDVRREFIGKADGRQ